MLGWMAIAKQTGSVLLEFNGGVEILASRANKGGAVRTLMSEMDPDTPTAYLGDDTTDEHAFEAVNVRGGLTVLVRSHPRTTSARLRLAPPDGVLDFLTQWLNACRARDTSSNNTTKAVTA